MLKITSKNFVIVLFALLLLGGLFFSFSPQAQALQVANYPSFLSNLRPDMPLTELISTLFKFLLMAAGLATFIMIVWGGVRYLTSAGDPSKMGDAKDQIFAAVLGLIILLSSWMILNTINPQLVELKEPSTLPSTNEPTWEQVRVPGTCVKGVTYAVEIYSKTNYGGDRKCFNAGEDESSLNGKLYSIKINSATVKLFDEANFSGKNICFQGNVPDLNRCILAGANDCPSGYAGWEKPKSFQIGATCSSPGTTLSASGEQIWEECWLPPFNKGYIPACIYK